MKLEIKYRKKTGKNTNTQRFNNMQLKSQWTKEEIKTVLQQMKMEAPLSKMYKMQQKTVLRGKFLAIDVYL